MKTAYFKKMLIAYAKQFDIDPFGCKLIQGFESLTLILCCKVKEECGHGDLEHGWNFTAANCHSELKEPYVKGS